MLRFKSDCSATPQPAPQSRGLPVTAPAGGGARGRHRPPSHAPRTVQSLETHARREAAKGTSPAQGGVGGERPEVEMGPLFYEAHA